jgi:hypothetical protein
MRRKGAFEKSHNVSRTLCSFTNSCCLAVSAAWRFVWDHRFSVSIKELFFLNCV